MGFRSIGDVIPAEARLRESGEGGVILTVVRSSIPSILPAARLVVHEDGRTEGVLFGAGDEVLAKDALDHLHANRSGLGSYEVVEGCPQATRLGQGDLEVFFEVLARRAQLIIVGAGHIAVPLAHIGALLDFDVTVLDDRAEYANAERFPIAREIVVGPYAQSLGAFNLHPSSYVVLVTRGHVHDQACLDLVLDSAAAYIGMIGSKRRVRTVLEAIHGRRSVPSDRHVYAPVGLDIGAQTPAEIAVSIMAEIVSVRRGRSASSLSRARSNA